MKVRSAIRCGVSSHPSDDGALGTGSGAGGRGLTDLLGASLEDDVLLALIQPPLSHGPVVQYPVLPLEELVQDI